MASEEKKTLLLTANANVGIGLWTSICVAFCKIFGGESAAYRMKVNRVSTSIKNRLYKEMDKYPNYKFEDFRIVKEGNLSLVGSVLGTLKEE